MKMPLVRRFEDISKNPNSALQWPYADETWSLYFSLKIWIIAR